MLKTFFYSVPYEKLENTTCVKTKPVGPFDTLEEARETCNADQSCRYILEKGCKGQAFLLCDTYYPIEDNSSCLHSKDQGKKSVI